ncbi:MAG TPA: hypothetical protein VLV54_14060 [Thermoanaerobaculia bacterium]|nr:hypothetical protein [Thermoanaerobaculia bacterium]
MSTSLDLSYDPTTGFFTLGNQSSTLSSPITGGFQIPLSATGTIQINAVGNIQFMPPAPLGPLPFNTVLSFDGNEGALLTAFNSDSVEITVFDLPGRDRVLGFVLFVVYTGPGGLVNGIETPPIFITQDSFDPVELTLNYKADTGQFTFSPAEGLEIPVEKGLILFRLGTSLSTQGPRTTVNLNDNGGSIQFVEPWVIFTPLNAATLHSHSATQVQFDRDFVDGTGVGVNFVIQVSSESGPIATVISPDPLILDKQIGTGGETFPAS